MSPGLNREIDPSTVEAGRRVELSVLAAIIERLPRLLSEEEVAETLTEAVRTPRREAEIRRAVQGLVDVGLVERTEFHLAPTAATRRLSEMELEL
jgi:predicted transcriptional regulator